MKCPLPGLRISNIAKPAGPSLPLPFTSLLHIEKLLEIQNRVSQIFPHRQARQQFLPRNLMQTGQLGGESAEALLLLRTWAAAQNCAEQTIDALSRAEQN